ncbi:hypothetical protein GGF31_006992 [Allomyces arbusculus]|nr:hypothetical protein GGF31_006992 [Allomyces arbusculus]
MTSLAEEYTLRGTPFHLPDPLTRAPVVDQDYVPIVFAPLEMNVTYGGVDDGCGTRQCALSLWDTAGQEDYGPLSCPETDVAVIFFTLTGPTARDSHNTVIHKYPEIKTFIPTARIVLVGTHRVVRDAYVQSTESTTASDQDRRAWIVTQE